MPKTIFSAGQECLQRLLRQMRREAGMTQAGFAKKLGRPQSFVCKYEIGERRLDLIEIQQICRVLGISLHEFIRRFERALKYSETKNDLE